MVRKAKKRYLDKYKKQAKKELKRPKRTSPSDRDAEEREAPALKQETKNSLLLVLVITLGLVSCLSFFGWAGRFGQMADTALTALFGWEKYIVPAVLFFIAYVIARPQAIRWGSLKTAGLAVAIASIAGFMHLLAVPIAESTAAINLGRGGGYIGVVLSWPLQKIMGPWATGIILAALFIASVMVVFDVSLKKMISGGGIFQRIAERFREFFYKLRMNMEATNDRQPSDDYNSSDQDPAQTAPQFNVSHVPGDKAEDMSQRAETNQASAAPAGNDEQMSMLPKKTKIKRTIDIPIDLLESSNEKPTSGDIEASKEKIRRTLENFGIEVEMGEAQVGPTVTQYTLKPAEGVKLSQITTLGNDLALALAAHPIRIEAPIPGKSLVGIEVPNQAVAVVKLKELLMSKDFKKRKSQLTISLGKDVAGNAWLADLDPMPHLLIAGATGSGKSVSMNSILISLLYQNSPDELKLILVDPKRVELTMYNDIPHLLTPVVTDVDKTINALRWVVAEMDRRYDLLSQTGHRNIQAYNRDNGNTMPYIVLAIDELADLMAVAANEVEAAIIRLAQMARAVGIHLILATQRPSVDIITGLIKANITSRIAFSVASVVDSRTILDCAGAEKLLGQGDLLYISPKLSKPKRLQGAYVSDQEIQRVLQYLQGQAKPEYEETVTQKVVDKTLAGNFEDLGDDELVDQAKDIVIKANKASASFLQRRLRIGYARAARLLDILEEQGVIGPGQGAKPREILIGGSTPDENGDYDSDDDQDSDEIGADEDREYEETDDQEEEEREL